MKKIGVSQKALITNIEGKILVLKRTPKALSNPNLWDLPGGDLEFGENAISGMIREIKEETGLDINELRPFDVDSRIDEKGDFWVTVAYESEHKSGNIVLSFEHDEYKWVSRGESLSLNLPDKIKGFIEKYGTK